MTPRGQRNATVGSGWSAGALPWSAWKQGDEVRRTLEEPGEIRVSHRDPQVHLFYRGGPPRWICAVARVSVDGGFLITAYPTDRIKVGDTIWTKSG